MKEKFLKAFSKDNLFYTLIFIISMVVIITNRIVVGFPPVLWLCDIGSIFSILYTINMAKHNVFGFIFNIVATAVMVVTGYYQHIWLNATVCLCINIPSMIIGLTQWIKNEKEGKQEENLKSMSKRTLFIMIALSLVVAGVFTYILYLLDGNLFYIDGIFSALCVMGVVLASKMYIEQYYFFMPANIIGVVLYVVLCFQDMSNLPYVVTNIIFTIVSFMGYANWKKLSHEQNCKDENCENCKENEEKMQNYPVFSLNEVESAIKYCFGEENCYYNNDDNLTLHKDILNTFSAVDHWCECEVSVVEDFEKGGVYLSDFCHTFINYTNEGMNYETSSYYAYLPVLKKLKRKYPHVDISCGEIRARVTSLDKNALLQLASDVVSVTYSIWHFLEYVVNSYAPCEVVGEGEFKDLSLEQMLDKLKDEGLKVLFDSSKRMFYLKKKKRYYLIYDRKGYKFSTLHFVKRVLKKGSLKAVECDYDKYVTALKDLLGEKFNESELSYTTFTYVKNEPIKLYLKHDKYGVYFTDRKWAKNRFKGYNFADLAFATGLPCNSHGEVCVKVREDILDKENLGAAKKDLCYDLEVAAIRMKDMDVYSMENVDAFYTKLRTLSEVESMIKCAGLVGKKVGESKILYKYECPFCERGLEFYLEEGKDFVKLKFDSFLQGDNFDIFSKLVKDKAVYYSSSDNAFYYNVIGKSTFETVGEVNRFIEFILLHNLLERQDEVIQSGKERLTKQFIEQTLNEVVESLKPLFNIEKDKNQLVKKDCYRAFVQSDKVEYVSDKLFGNIVISEVGSKHITSSIIENILKSKDEKLIYLINHSNYFTKATKESFEKILREVILLTLAVKNL